LLHSKQYTLLTASNANLVVLGVHAITSRADADSSRHNVTPITTVYTTDAQAGDVAAALQELGGAAIVLATAFNAEAMSKLIDGLKRNGVMVSTTANTRLTVNVDAPRQLYSQTSFQLIAYS
jgi:D-arabinose 1-dehydrogenase-like Zn-dependent alcohol dehydrogenase